MTWRISSKWQAWVFRLGMFSLIFTPIGVFMLAYYFNTKWQEDVFKSGLPAKLSTFSEKVFYVWGYLTLFVVSAGFIGLFF